MRARKPDHPAWRRGPGRIAAGACALLLSVAARADVLRVPQDFATIQLAIDASQPGDEVVIAAGSYAESPAIDSLSSLRVRGKGQVTLTGARGVDPIFAIIGSTDIQVERLRIEGASGVGLRISGTSQDVTVRHCRISGTDDEGLVVVESNGVLLEHLDVSATRQDGLFVTATDFLEVRHCTFTDVDLFGIEVEGGTGHLIEHVEVSGAGEAGIFLGSSLAVEASIIRKCRVSDVSLSGIVARGDGLLIEDNLVLPPASIGVLLNGGSCIVRNNRLIDVEFYGVHIFSGTHQVLDNRIVRAGSTGIRVDSVLGAPDQLLADNRVLKSLGDGILLGVGSDGCTLFDNRILAPAKDGLYVLAAAAHVVGNRVIGAGEDGLHLEGAGSVVVGNRAKGSTQFDLNDTSSNGNTYVDNDFGTQHFD